MTSGSTIACIRLEPSSSESASRNETDAAPSRTLTSKSSNWASTSFQSGVDGGSGMAVHHSRGRVGVAAGQVRHGRQVLEPETPAVPGAAEYSPARRLGEPGAGVARTIGSVQGEALLSLRRAEPAVSVDLVLFSSLLRRQSARYCDSAIRQKLHSLTVELGAPKQLE